MIQFFSLSKPSAVNAKLMRMRFFDTYTSDEHEIVDFYLYRHKYSALTKYPDPAVISDLGVQVRLLP